MRKMTIIVAVALAATSAFASKARLKALSNAAHLSDTRDVFSEPDKAANMGEFVSLEASNNTAKKDATGAVNGDPGGNDAATNAEGGFVRKWNDNMAMGAWLGNKDSLATAALKVAGADTATGTTIQNPLNLYFASKAGDMAWGVGLNYSNYEHKGNKDKASSMGLNVGASTATWEASLGLGLTGEATDNDATKYEQKSPMSLHGGYWMDTMFLYGDYTMGGGKSKNIVAGTTASDVDVNAVQLGIINSHKKDGADFFYGASYLMFTNKVKDGTKTELTALPVVIGIEADANSWMVLRASITQYVLLGTWKSTPNGGSGTDITMTDNTTVASGLGLKLGKFTVDGSLAATTAAGGKLGTDTSFLSEVGLTYMF
jgi:hypothetical protein